MLNEFSSTGLGVLVGTGIMSVWLNLELELSPQNKWNDTYIMIICVV